MFSFAFTPPSPFPSSSFLLPSSPVPLPSLPTPRTHTHTHTRYTEFKDCKAKAVVQAIESVVEFKTRVKAKVLTAFKEAQAARGPPLEEALSGADSLPWIPSPDDQSYYEYVNRWFHCSQRSPFTANSS